MTKVKVLLNNNFPAGICEDTCDYNLQCFKCKNWNLKENELQKERKGKHLTKSEKKQIRFLQDRNANTNILIQHQPNKPPTNEK